MNDGFVHLSDYTMVPKAAGMFLKAMDVALLEFDAAKLVPYNYNPTISIRLNGLSGL